MQSNFNKCVLFKIPGEEHLAFALSCSQLAFFLFLPSLSLRPPSSFIFFVPFSFLFLYFPSFHPSFLTSFSLSLFLPSFFSHPDSLLSFILKVYKFIYLQELHREKHRHLTPFSLFSPMDAAARADLG